MSAVVLSLLVAVAYAIVMMQVSVWRTRKELDGRSTELVDPQLRATTDRLARALDLPRIPVHVYEIEAVKNGDIEIVPFL